VVDVHRLGDAGDNVGVGCEVVPQRGVERLGGAYRALGSHGQSPRCANAKVALLICFMESSRLGAAKETSYAVPAGAYFTLPTDQSMSKLPLTFACGLYDRLLALQTREVVPEGIDLNFVAIDEPRKIFDQMVTHRAYDASEMSASEHVAMVASGNSAFV